VDDLISLCCRRRVDETPLVRCCVGQSCKAARIEQAPTPADGNSGPGDMTDLIVFDKAAGGKTDKNSGGVVELLAWIFYEVVGEGCSG
jgi:hypothetical protein